MICPEQIVSPFFAPASEYSLCRFGLDECRQPVVWLLVFAFVVGVYVCCFYYGATKTT